MTPPASPDESPPRDPGAQPSLRTARLLLRPFTADDAEKLERLVGAREIADTTANIPHPYPKGGGAVWIATHAPGWHAGTDITYAVTTASDGALVGAVSLHRDADHAHAEMGYWIAVEQWGRGYATEAAIALAWLGFARLDLHRLQARHLTRNPASGRVMRKLGMREEGVLRESVRKWGRWEDIVMWAVLAPEWWEAGHPVPDEETQASEPASGA